MEKQDDKSLKYFNSIHRLGRIGSIFSILAMVGTPYMLALYYDLDFSFTEVLSVATTLLAIFIPTVLAEFISYGPVLGSGTYLAYITGNVTNLKIPCALNAQALLDLEQGTEESDVISIIAIATSSLVTMIVIALGVVLLIPLTPILQTPQVQTATKYILPALFGSMLFTMFSGNKMGKNTIKGKLRPLIIPALLILFYNFFINPIAGKEGIWIVITIVISAISTKIMLSKGIVKIISEKKESN